MMDCRYTKLDKTFYFHAIESNNRVKDFPIGILEAKRLVIYSGGRGNPYLTGLTAEIKSVELKHKSDIIGKEKSTTEFYYEVILNEVFIDDENIKFAINVNTLFDKSDERNRKLLQQFLPALTTWERILKSIDKKKIYA